MGYNLNDLKQSSIGAFMGIIIFLAIRGNNPFYFDHIKGLVITGILVLIYYNGFRMKSKFEHFAINIVVTFGVSAAIANTFNLIAWSEVFSITVFGSLVIIAFWVGLIQAMLYDRYNFTSPMSRYYVRGK